MVTRWEVGTDWDFQAGAGMWRDSVRSWRGGGGGSEGRPGTSRIRGLEEIGLQGGAGLPVKRGQNPRERPGPGLCWLPGLKQVGRACARPAAPTTRHAGPQWALKRLGPGDGPGAQGSGQRAGAQARAGQAGRGRRRQRRGAVGRWAARGLLGVVVL